jgi:Trypsin
MSNPKGAPKVVNEKGPAQVPRFLDKLEQISRISFIEPDWQISRSPVMIPVVIALIGYFGNNLLHTQQNIIEQKKIDLEYVKIAKDVATNLKEGADPLLAKWGYQTLFQLSPVQVLSPEEIDDLSRRRVPLPSSTPPTVLGGVNSSIANWPWLVSVYAAGRFICNGTLIAPRTVLSAAQCVSRGQASNYEVATVTDDGKYVKILKRTPVTKIVVHPEYSKDTAKNDIGILELDVELPPPFAPISAQRSVDPKAGTLALVAALGFGSLPGSLLQSSVPIVGDATCAAKYGDQSAPEGIICAAFERGGAGACPGTGSAGGPLVVLSGEGRKYLVGIVSLADCSVPEEAFGFYTRVSTYADWIKQTVPNVLSEPMAEVNR